MSSKYNYKGNNKFDLKTQIKNIYIGEVISTDDPTDMGRIKIRIKGEDDAIANDNDLPWAFPMIPKFLGMTPQVKEATIVFIFDSNTKYSDRLFFGPIISQPQNLEFDPLYFSALAPFSFGPQNPSVSPSTIPNAKGVFPDKKYISLQGRDNTDLVFKNGEVLLRAGKYVKKLNKKKNSNEPQTDESEKDSLNFEFNTSTQGYIQIKYNAILSEDKKEKGSVTNIVSNKINLLTHKGSPSFNLLNQDDLISAEELLKILKDAHPLPFGDILIQWMILCEQAIFNHVHNGNNPATDLTTSGNKLSIAEFKKQASDLRARLNSKNIKIN